jgi:hypothetical protein
MKWRSFIIGIIGMALCTSICAEPVPVRHPKGVLRGFLLLRALDGKILASGDLIQVVKGANVTNELSFQFKDGSVHKETTVFSQRRTNKLLTYRLVQKGPSFPRPTDMSINQSTGKVTVRYTDDDGKEKTIKETLELPADVANGMVVSLLHDMNPKNPKATVSMVASTPKPRLVKLDISAEGEETFTVGGAARKATRYVVKVEIGGVAGVVAPLVGKQPPDTYIWMVAGAVPGFLKSEGPLFPEGPIWRIELASPDWPKNAPGPKP